MAAGAEGVPLPAGGTRETWRASRLLRHVAAQSGAEVAHAHHNTGHNLALLATLGGGFPPVVANRGVLAPLKFPAKFKNRRTAAIIANSVAAKNVLVESGVPERKIHVVYNAKRPPDDRALLDRLPVLREELSLPPSTIVGAIGGGKPEKGFDYLIEAAPRILERFPGTVFLLLGTQNERIRGRIDDLGLADSFRLPGFHREAATVAALFDVFVLPSLTESCPNVLLEARAVGVPAVCSDVGAVPDILGEHSGGRLVRPGDAGALASAVCEVLSDLSHAKAAARGDRLSFLDKFSPARKAEGTLAVYRKVLEERTR